MKFRCFVVCCAALAVAVSLLGAPAFAQNLEDPPPAGIDSGNYNVKQTFEIGYRITEFTGNRDIYNTFVNLNPGPRLLNYTLELRSLNHKGWLFDNLYLSNFGYGGDPNDVTTLRMYKNKWYTLNAKFRRDRNFWDYNLFANPLNPDVAVANAPAGFSPTIDVSPHRFETTRRMTDVNLMFLPQSPVRLRLGYNRNVSEGPSFSSFHEGTDVLLFQPWKTTIDGYQFGVDFRYLPKTNISYDYFFYYYKGDTRWELADTPFTLSDLTPVDLGLPIDTANNSPCRTPFNATPPGTVNPACNAYFAYNRFGRVRTSYPTNQLTFQSTYFKNLDLSGRLSYASSGGNRRGDVLDYNEFFQGLVTRTNQRQFDVSGPAHHKRIQVSTDFGATYYINDKLRILDMFRFANFRIPGVWDSLETSLFGATLLDTPNIFTPGATPPSSCPTGTESTCPQHNIPRPGGTSASPADIAAEVFHQFLKQDLKNNLLEVEYDFTKRMGARVGYRYRHRNIIHAVGSESDLLFFPTFAARGACAFLPAPAPPNTLPANCTQLPDGSIHGVVVEDFESDPPVKINEHSALFGFWARPMDALRVSFDLELMSADNTFTRISPRQLQHYKLRATYRVNSWTTVGGTVNILESRDNVFQIDNLQHNRSYGFNVVMEPAERFGFDLGYDYNDVFSTTFICYPITPNTGNLPACFAGTGLFGDTSTYMNKSNYAYFDVHWRPIPRVNTRLGYSLVSTSGETLIISPNAPPGPLAYNYHRPYAGFTVDLAKGFAWKTDWAYYGYNEKSLPGPGFGPRDFRGNMVTLAFRYSF